jgi:hypothetical protein
VVHRDADVPLGRGECLLPQASADVLLTDKLGIFTTTDDVVAVWQVGPRTPATQPLLRSTVHAYFLNVSRIRAGDAPTSRDAEVDKDDADVPGAAPHLADRLRALNRLYTTRDDSLSQLFAGRKEIESTTHNSGSEDARSGVVVWWVGAVGTVRAALLPCWRLVSFCLHRVGALDPLRRLTAEVYANARVRTWSCWSAWRDVFATRHLVVRFPLHMYHDDHDHDHDVAGDELLSRMDMAASGTLSFVRLVSFPPVAQLTHEGSPRYACSLPAVTSAGLLSTDVQPNRVQRSGGTARTNGKPYSLTANTAAAAFADHAAARTSPSASRGMFVFHILDFALRMLRRLFNSDDGQYDPSSGGGEGGFPYSSFFRQGHSTAAVRNAVPPKRSVSTPAAVAARVYLQLVREELGPYLSSAASSLPMALQQLIRNRELSTATRLLEEAPQASSSLSSLSAATPLRGGDSHRRTAGRVKRAPVRYVMEWAATLPAGAPMCLALVALPHSDSTSQETTAGLTVQLEETLTFDALWGALMVAAYVVWQLERRVVQSVVARHVVTGLTGTLLLSVMAFLYVLRELQRMSVGRLAVVAALIVGGSTAMLEGVCNVLWTYYHLDDLWVSTSSPASVVSAGGDRSPLLIAACLLFLLVFAVNDLLFNCLVPVAYLNAVTRWSVRVLLVLLWWLSLRHNAEATLLAVAGSFLLRRSFQRWGRWGHAGYHPRTPFRPRQPSQNSSRQVGDAAWGLEDPVHAIPAEALQARAYVRPLAAGPNGNYAALHDADARLRKYEEDGTVSTRRALEELAAHLRANPGKYAARLRDPNGLQRWAGGASDSGADDESECD